MVVLDISDPTNVTVSKRVKNAFHQQDFPPLGGYFECVDPSKGVVISWERTTLENPQCFR